MTIQKKFVPPALPLPTEDYSARYTNEMNKILRLYFENLDTTLTAVLELLNNGGYFPEINAGTVNANNVITQALDSTGITASTLISNYITSGAFQGGNGIFNNLTAANSNASLFTGAGHQINYPHIGATGNADQYATANNTPTIVQWDTAEEIRGFSLASNKATATYAGVYKIDYSLQFVNTANTAYEVTVWLRVNNSDVARSATRWSIPARKSAGVYTYIVAYSTIMFECQAGNDFALWWATDQAYSPTGPVDGIYMEYVAAQSSPYAHPAIPAAIGTIVYVSAPVPARTVIVPVSAPGTGKVGSPTIRIVNNNA